MTESDEDRELTRLFQELRQTDAASAPPFRRMLPRPQAVKRPSRLWSVAAASAGALVALLLLWFAGALRNPPAVQRTGGGAVSLGDWRSPTDFLLRTPAGALLEERPVLVEPVPDYSERKSVRAQKGARS